VIPHCLSFGASANRLTTSSPIRAYVASLREIWHRTAGTDSGNGHHRPPLVMKDHAPCAVAVQFLLLFNQDVTRSVHPGHDHVASHLHLHSGPVPLGIGQLAESGPALVEDSIPKG